MTTKIKPKGRWIHRFAIRFLTFVLTILVVWLLNFLINDIRSVPGPRLDRFTEQFVSKELLSEEARLTEDIQQLTTQINNLSERQGAVGDTSGSLRDTVTQLVHLNSVSLKNNRFSPEQQQKLNENLEHFLEIRNVFEQLIQEKSKLITQRQKLNGEKDKVSKELSVQRAHAVAQYDKAMHIHRMKLAFLQLALLIPILGLVAFLMIRFRGHAYYPLMLAPGIATLIQVAFVIHEYFPSKYFKYVLAIALILTVAYILVHFIKTVARPKQAWLVKQFREAYERFLCPVCEYPIRVGPRRFMYWTRRTVNKLGLPGEQASREEPYTCPVCGTCLFEKCESCQQIRHAKLPNCRHCGAEKQIFDT
ncbi:MAG: hypothetical protein GX811_05955 [Lentisphaerae bacterium]|nr:hypothetical protein [Lentisphaerota bacterium]